MGQDTAKNKPSTSTVPDNLSPAAREALLELSATIRKGTALSETEYFWRDHAAWLESIGYKLRPRYQPGWEPDIPAFQAVTLTNENLVPMARAAIVDAICIKDGKRVLLKKTLKAAHPYEVEITTFLGTAPLADDPRNYCVPLRDTLHPPDTPDLTILVFPFLQQLDALPFDTFGEIVDFIRQMLNGLQFIHENHVAHRDIGVPNLMMDGDELFPDGWNQRYANLTPEGEEHTNVFTRTQRPPKYYFIDFGLARRYDPSDPNPLEEPIFGGDRTVPEFKTNKESFNPFHTDIYYAGNTIRRFITEGTDVEWTGYYGTDFLRPLIQDMVQDDPTKRPTIDEVVTRFEDICKKLGPWKLRSRPAPRRGSIFKGLRSQIDHWKRRIDFIKRGVPPIPSRQPTT
ncbi:hypothetical protein BDN72DRAFT_833673 [Pluteus cervinus]|uniref:Uncharacterized protein n=1 Tax=Pluteus cervinus TaxID=181527 RepID=A0ACD3B8S8_9AGAR|nr:hypothetical protein BDN72DRAFT_833673 [Pluteus cervinus]